MRDVAAALDRLEAVRVAAVADISTEGRKRLGQVLTPVPVAQLLGETFSDWSGDISIIDPGAGAGTLGAVAALQSLSGDVPPSSVRVSAWELDSGLAARSEESLAVVADLFESEGIPFHFEVRNEDFLRRAAQISGRQQPCWVATHAILNPPYAKLSAVSDERALAEEMGAPVPNLYAAFLLASSALLKAGGEIVAITPRSFYNGSYFKKFRKALLDQNGLRSIRVFNSRTCAFADQGVLQETAVTHMVRGVRPSETIRVQVGDPDGPMAERDTPSGQVVLDGDSDAVIHVVESERSARAVALINSLPATLDTLGVTVSTGPVVEFRARPHLRAEHAPGTVPLLHPSSVGENGVSWQRSNGKPPAIEDSEATAPMLTQRGNYVLVKRFTSKEERRRVVAAPLLADAMPDCQRFGIENHINYLHNSGESLGRRLAIGLAAFLNHELVDVYFRSFSGHTQVNAADLRRIRIPDQAILEDIGSAPNPREACGEWIGQLSGERL